MNSFFFDSHGAVLWTVVAGVTFAVIFSVVGIFRVVEFQGVGLTPLQKGVFIPAHILGCFLFASVMILITADPTGIHRSLMNGLFGSGFAILFPIHIYVGLKRRIRIRSLN